MASALEPRSGVNRQIVLAARPVGMPQDSDFRMVDGQLPHPGAGEVLVRTLYISVDPPHLRGRFTGQSTYGKGLQVGEVIAGGVVGVVVQSNDPRMVRGEIVEGVLGWQEYAVAHAKTLRKIDPNAFPITTALYALGTPGLTAYFGLLDICRPQPGETVVVSAAAGAVGSFAGQIAKIRRCRVIGIAGSKEKIDYITRDLGFDGGFNYRETPDHYGKLRELCPNGVDVYFDNVGGDITDAVVRAINTRARIAVCGQISQYNSEEPPMGPRWLGQLVVKQARVEGFLVSQFSDRFDEALKQISTWLREGRLHYREEIVDGLENAPRAFIGMMHGKNTGKELVRVAHL